MLAISIQPEYLFSIGPYQVYNTLLSSIIVTLALSVLSVFVYVTRRQPGIVSAVPRLFIRGVLYFTDTVTGDRMVSLKLFPLVATLFLYIAVSNIIELIPGFLGSVFVVAGGRHVPLFRSPTSDLNTTLALAIISVVVTQAIVVRSVGILSYIRRFLNFSGPIQFILGIFEFLSESMRFVSFSFRLFGNVFAGEVLLLVSAYFLPVFLPVPFMALEVFVGLIQAFIFAVLTLAFIRMDTTRQYSTT